jgi:hypothetical protein
LIVVVITISSLYILIKLQNKENSLSLTIWCFHIWWFALLFLDHNTGLGVPILIHGWNISMTFTQFILLTYVGFLIQFSYFSSCYLKENFETTTTQKVIAIGMTTCYKFEKGHANVLLHNTVNCWNSSLQMALDSTNKWDLMCKKDDENSLKLRSKPIEYWIEAPATNKTLLDPKPLTHGCRCP